MWSDNETVDDLLGFQVHADLIRSVVTDVQGGRSDAEEDEASAKA
jgi:hypothetical protein